MDAQGIGGSGFGASGYGVSGFGVSGFAQRAVGQLGEGTQGVRGILDEVVDGPLGGRLAEDRIELQQQGLGVQGSGPQPHEHVGRAGPVGGAMAATWHPPTIDNRPAAPAELSTPLVRRVSPEDAGLWP